MALLEFSGGLQFVHVRGIQATEEAASGKFLSSKASTHYNHLASIIISIN